MFEVKSLKEQEKIHDQILKERLEDILPTVLNESEVDAWLVVCREYNEDLVFRVLTPASYLTARRTMILAFVKDHGIIKRFSFCMPDEDLDKYYESAYKFNKEDQMEALNKILNQYDVKKIALNTSKESVFADGMTSGVYETFINGLDEKFKKRLTSDSLISTRLMEIRTKTEIALYPHVLDAAFYMIESMFSSENIIPNKTTTDDLVWYIKELARSLSLELWFNPTVDFQREDELPQQEGVIQAGDLLHCDFGIRYMNICTDTQRNAYVAKGNETEVPEVIAEGFKINNRFQDIVTGYFKEGRSGNEILKLSLNQAKKENIDATLYSHPTNVYGHGPGPTIGLYSNQDYIPYSGDISQVYDTVYALELNVRHKNYTLYSEETVLFDESGIHYLYPKRDEIYFIK